VVGEQVVGMQAVVGFPAVEGLVVRPDTFPSLHEPGHASPLLRVMHT
jgi:hypothetical protein